MYTQIAAITSDAPARTWPHVNQLRVAIKTTKKQSDVSSHKGVTQEKKI